MHPTLSVQREREVLLRSCIFCRTYLGVSEEGSGEGVAVFYSERRRELLMLSLIRGGEKAASHNLYTAFCLKQRIRGLQSEQEKERLWGQEVLVSPPREAQSCQGYSRNIVMWGERGQAELASLYGIIHTLSSSLH